MAKKQKYYVVWRGVSPGVYDSWTECKLQINGFEGAKYKSFETKDEAVEAFRNSPDAYYKKRVTKPVFSQTTPMYILKSLSVDAACSGNPGILEYRGVYVGDRKEVFKMGPFEQGTNNVGEFLAIVHGLALLKKLKLSIPIYSDSKTAIAWVRNKKCNSKLKPTSANQKLFDLIYRAELWLNQNSYTTPIYKWETENWGEIPADFGRK